MNTETILSASQKIEKLTKEMKKVIVGQERLMRNLLVALFARGHVIVEGVPGLAKTLVIETLGKALGVDVSRIQFTPDLLPSDLVGTQIWNQATGEFFTQKGPLFSHLIIADEINRSPAKVQSALLEAMAEQQITLAQTTYELEQPFIVMATQNPVENDGTYDLPEAQLDRFLLKTILTYPTQEQEITIMKRFSGKKNTSDVLEVVSKEEIIQIQTICDSIHISNEIFEYVKNIVVATRFPEAEGLPELTKYITFGSSPRASIALIKCAKVIAVMQGRDFVIPEDVQEIAVDVLQHRISISFEAMTDGITQEGIIQKIIAKIPLMTS